IKWAMGAIVNWDNDCIPEDCIHIHGRGDLLLPARFTKPKHVIAKAGHMMIMTHAEEINAILRKELGL
ncbi:MAG TPA: hypothetical protein VD996_02880, partial [Chitinophagaceae bacterium]|nr:hypothetical protein [Chitinophagaceae bacterium]